jgi:hypothetical protein
VFQTIGTPRIGNTVRATIGSTANISSELRNSVVANSHTMPPRCRLPWVAGSAVFVTSITVLSRAGVHSP